MRIFPVLAVAGLLALAGCSSDADPASGTPDPAALASSIAAQATSPAAAASSAGADRAVGTCGDGQMSAQAALSATVATDVSLPDGCTSLKVTVPDDVDPGVGQALCGTAASEAYRYGIEGVVVVTASGTELATGKAPSLECTLSG